MNVKNVQILIFVLLAPRPLNQIIFFIEFLCQKNGVHLSQFDLLEERLTRGTRYEEDKENGYVDTYVF